MKDLGTGQSASGNFFGPYLPYTGLQSKYQTMSISLISPIPTKFLQKYPHEDILHNVMLLVVISVCRFPQYPQVEILHLFTVLRAPAHLPQIPQIVTTQKK